MYVIRWIMRHMVIVFIGGFVATGFYFKDDLRAEMNQLGVTKMISAAASTVSNGVIDILPPSVIAYFSEGSDVDAPAAELAGSQAPVSEAPVSDAPAVEEAAEKSPATATVTANAPQQMPTHMNAPVEGIPAAEKSVAEVPATASAPAASVVSSRAANMSQQMPTHLGAPAQTRVPAQTQPHPYYGHSRAPQGNAFYQQRANGYVPRYAQPAQGHYGHPQALPPRGYASPSMGAAYSDLSEETRAQWSAARNAFWQRDSEKTETLYKSLLDATSMADVAGELGNIYFMQRRFKDAAAMYFEAGLRHLNSPNPMRAGMVLSALGQLDPQKAMELQQKIMIFQQAQAGLQMQQPQGVVAQPE